MPRAKGISEAHIAFERDVRARVYDVIRREPDRDRAREAIGKILAGATEKAGDSLPWLFEFTLAIDTLAGPRYSAAFRQRLLFDPAPHLRKLRIPVLSVFGTLDVQVSAEANAPLMRAAIAQSASSSDVVVMDGLNHAFQTARTGTVDEYAALEETISPKVLARMTSWLGRVTRK